MILFHLPVPNMHLPLAKIYNFFSQLNFQSSKKNGDT